MIHDPVVSPCFVCHIVVVLFFVVLRVVRWYCMPSVDMAFVVVHYLAVDQLLVPSHPCDVNEVQKLFVCAAVCVFDSCFWRCRAVMIDTQEIHCFTHITPSQHFTYNVHNTRTQHSHTHNTHMRTTHAHSTHTHTILTHRRADAQEQHPTLTHSTHKHTALTNTHHSQTYITHTHRSHLHSHNTHTATHARHSHAHNSHSQHSYINKKFNEFG